MEPVFFEKPEEFRQWLAQHHESETELWVGYHKTSTKLPSITWPQSVDEALCYGWIDGLRKSLGETSYMIRFTPRKPTSVWSAVNLKRVPELIEEGRMKPKGMAAWEHRSRNKRSGYSTKDFDRKLGDAEEKELKADEKAWEYFQSQAPSYQRSVSYWVMNAKREETKRSRLDTLISECAKGKRVDQFTAYASKKKA